MWKQGRGARGEPPPFSYADFCKPFPFPAQPGIAYHQGFSPALGQDVSPERLRACFEVHLWGGSALVLEGGETQGTHGYLQALAMLLCSLP